MRGSNKGQQANTVIPEGFPIKRFKAVEPEETEAFMTRLTKKLEGEEELLEPEEGTRDVVDYMDGGSILQIP